MDYFTLRQRAVEEKAAERARVREYITLKRSKPQPQQVRDVVVSLRIFCVEGLVTEYHIDSKAAFAYLILTKNNNVLDIQLLYCLVWLDLSFGCAYVSR